MRCAIASVTGSRRIYPAKRQVLDYQDLESQESMQLLTAALEGEKESGGIYWFSDKLGVLIGDVASIFYAFVVLVPILTQQQHLTGNGVMQISKF